MNCPACTTFMWELVYVSWKHSEPYTIEEFWCNECSITMSIDGKWSGKDYDSRVLAERLNRLGAFL